MDTIENTTMNIPVLALRGLTIFPGCVLSFDVERDISIRALERAMEGEQYIFLVAQRELTAADPGERDLYHVGTVSLIRQILRLNESSVRVMMEGRTRARLRRLWQTEPYLQGNVEPVREAKARISDFQLEALDLLLESPVFALTFDIGHNHSIGGTDEPPILERRTRLVHFHFHDAQGKKNHLPLGAGEIDIPKNLALAKSCGGRIVLETKTVSGLRESVQWMQKDLASTPGS